MNPELAKRIAEKELNKRKAPPPNVLGECFPEQLSLINDISKRKIACLTRRSGKSTTMGLYLINEALKNPRSKSVYVNLTKDIAKKVMWTDIFETIILKLNIPAELIGLDIKFKNGSVISLTGADATYKEKQKLRGQKNILAVIDECQSFTQDLEELVISVILPTLADYNGTLCMIGTPGDQMGLHYWWRLNNPENKDINKAWTYFHWGWKDNPHVRDNMQKQIDELIAANPKIQETTKFRQEYLGEWAVEESARVYKSSAHNYIDSIPPAFYTGVIYDLALDLGYEDATSFVLLGFNPKFDDVLYVLESHKYVHMVTTEVAEMIKSYRGRYNLRRITVDAGGGAKQSVEDMRKTHGLPLWAADKPGKYSHISMLNSDFITGKVKILKSFNKQLIQELETLLWNPKLLAQGEHKEADKYDNHLADALLYGHNSAYHFRFEEKPVINPNSEDHIRKQLMDMHMKNLNKQQNSLEVNYDLGIDYE